MKCKQYLATNLLCIAMVVASLTSVAEAHSYKSTYTRTAVHKPCPALASELNNKIIKLKRLAVQKRQEGNRYGERRLLSTANVIAAHRGNLPCVNRRSCGI